MQTIEFNIEEPLLSQVDQAAKTLAMTRADFIQVALQRALQRQRIIALERQHEESYARNPQTNEEIEEWESEQDWGE